MADPSPGREGAAVFADEIRRIWAAIRDISSPSGTQQFNAVPKLQEAIAALQQQQSILADQQIALAGQQAQLTALVANIDATLTDFIQNDVDEIVNASVASAINAALSASDITIGQPGGTVHIPALYSTDITATGRPRIVVWVDADGLVGHT
jgi:hypothetical protein